MRTKNPYREKVPSRRVGFAAVGLVVMLILFFAGHSVSVMEPAPLSRDDVVALVIADLINPKTLDHDVIAFLDDQPLNPGDTVTVFYEEGGTYVMDSPTWFVWIDDDPLAEFAHETRYVFVDEQTGSIDIHVEEWWPQLNGEVLWAEQEDMENPVDVIYSTVHLEP